MGVSNLVQYHIESSINAAIAEASGYREEAERLRAQGSLRLVVMSDGELRELAQMLSYYPSRPPEVVYFELKAAVAEQVRTARQWVGLLTAKPYRALPISRN